jgi:hypothetical protein
MTEAEEEQGSAARKDRNDSHTARRWEWVENGQLSVPNVFLHYTFVPVFTEL